MCYRRISIIVLIVVLSMSSLALAVDNIFNASATTINIEDLLRIHGNLRYGLNLTNDFSESPSYTHHDLRSRLTLNFMPTEKEQGVVELQSWKVLGQGGESSGSSDLSVALSQAYISVDDCLGNNIGGKIGHMRYQVANERIIGDNSWDLSRSFDGGVFYLGDKRMFTHYDEVQNPNDPNWIERIEILKGAEGPQYGAGIGGELLLFKIDENSIDDDDDNDFMGANIFIPKVGLMPFAYYDRDNVMIGGHRRAHIYTLGTYGKFDIGKNLLIEGNVGLQTGKFRFGPDDEDKEDISAYLLQVDAFFYMGDYERPLAFGVGLDMTSGDDGEDENKYKVWTDRFSSTHEPRGRADLFDGMSVYGVTDLVGRVAYYPSQKVKTGLDLHLMRTSVEYSTGENETSKSLGTEIDFFLRYDMHQRTGWSWEVNYVKPSEDWAGPDADGYLSMIMRAHFSF
ncbi:MAG: Plug domain-containing protein [Candidatus Zixiibacteriota bacterium]